MKLVNNIKAFLYNAGYDKLFLTFIPAFCAIVCANNAFSFNFADGLIILIAILIAQLGIQVLDDYIYWISGYKEKLKDLELTGVRALYSKGDYIIKNKKKAKVYFYLFNILFILSITLITLFCIKNNDYKLFFTIPILIFIGLIKYLKRFEKYLKFFGTETIISLICAPLTIISAHYAASKCILPQAYMLCIIFFFMVFNLCFISSTLNKKADMITDKITFPIIINNEKYEIYFSLFFTFIPFILTYTAISLNIMPMFSYITFILIPQAIWQFYLMYQFKKTPQNSTKWNILMGADKYKTQNEQNNLSWFSVRYNFARNIFVTYGIILAITLIDYSKMYNF